VKSVLSLNSKSRANYFLEDMEGRGFNETFTMKILFFLSIQSY